MARSRVLSSLSHIHLTSTIMGSKTPFFALVCPANSSSPVQIRCCYVPRGRVVRKLDPRQGEKAQVKSWSGYGHSVGQSVLTSVARTLKPELPGPVTRIHDATKVNTG